MRAPAKFHEPAWLLAFLDRVCTSEVSYATAKAAHLALTRPKIARRLEGCAPDRCSFCGEIHLGHPRATA
jgi:hypothetical protein